MGGKIAAIFLIIIVIGIVLYIYNSGVVGKGSDFFKNFFPHFPTSSLNYGYGSGSGNGGGTGVGGGTYIGPQPTPKINPADIPKGFTESQLSPYFHQVRFGGISPGPGYYYYGGSYGQITLYAYPPNQSSSINVTGWQIKANRGGEYIPQAVNFYDPLGLNPATDIKLKSGDVLNIYSSTSAVNLRLNSCIGYLPNLNQFNPGLPQTCPSIDRSGLQSFTGACQNYITSLNGCRQPDFSSPQLPQNDYSCRDYLANKFNYRWCYDKYFSDPGFLSHEVRVWMGSSPVDQYHDQVQLLDRNGLLVDLYTY